MIERRPLPILKQHPDEIAVVVLPNPHQLGKTTLVLALAGQGGARYRDVKRQACR